MAIYSMGGPGGVGTTGVASVEIIAAAATKPKIMELSLSQIVATASIFSIGRPAATGLVPTTPVTVQDEADGGGPAGTTTTAIAWGTPPTVPVVFLRRLYTPATIGAGIIWTFPRGLGIPVGKSIVIWNSGTNSTIGFHVVVDE